MSTIKTEETPEVEDTVKVKTETKTKTKPKKKAKTKVKTPKIKLVIVESPSKAKTINKYLGKSFVVASSKGHLIDLPKSRMAIDIENGFQPEYKTVHGRAKDLKALKQQAAKAQEVLLAADPDREGEAISWHLYNALKSVNDNIHRITFNEITAEAIKEAVKNTGEIDIAMVNAQQARRIMDRLLGYNLSPLLWKKVKSGLSAGRVQSVAMRIICEREREVQKFIPDEYWDLAIELRKDKYLFQARVSKYNNEKIERIPSRAEAEKIVDAVKNAELKIKDIQTKMIKRKPLAPYTTSKMQQDAVNRLGFTAKKTMQVAQKLYEGIDLKGAGRVGLITYMRTDSTRISDQALESVREHITREYGLEYLPENPNVYAKRKGAQDAHEAIRPTSVVRTPENVKASLDRSEYRLYKLIWERFVASQMTESVTRSNNVSVNAGDYLLSVSGSRVEFPGFTKVFSSGSAVKAVKGIDKLKIDDLMTMESEKMEQKFTQPPPRYNEASLVKVLEESGIGRPSTYAPIINTLIYRNYVIRENKQLIPTKLGVIVNDLLVENFPEILNVNFTASMEKELDEIADENREWHEAVRDFYGPFSSVLQKAHENIEKLELKLDEPTDLKCEKCGSMMLKKLGRYGYFLACSAFPDCRNIKPLPLGKCPRPDCEGDVVKKKARRGRSFFGCTAYPECDFATYNEILPDPCPQCGKVLVRVIEDKVPMKKCMNESCGFMTPLEKQ